MGKYERIAFDLLESILGDRWVRDDTRIYSLGPGAGSAEVDGTIDGWIAVEVGAGSMKQIRASVLDLALHPYPRKLLVLVDTPGRNTEGSLRQAETFLERLGCMAMAVRLCGSSEAEDAIARLSGAVRKLTR